jgi:menaquinone-specific isochorismate synthase
MNSTSSSLDNAIRVGEFTQLLLPVISAGLTSGAIHRMEFDIENGENFSPRWLDAGVLYPKFFWRSRSGGSPVAAMGAVAVGTLVELENLLQCSDPGVRIFGGARFDVDRESSKEWAEFYGSRFFIPRAEIIRSGATTRLAINFINGQTHASDVSCWLAAILAEERPVNPSVLTRWDQPNFSSWAKTTTAALQAFESGEFSKVVLGRKSSMELAQAVSPFALTEILMAGAPACFHFCFQPSPDSGGFLGASPELLYRRIGRAIQSEAVAGTRPRSLDPSEDERLEFQLLEFSKEQLEHRLVVESLSESFKKLCLDFSCDEKPSVLKLARVQHLRTALRGTLRKGVGDSAIIAMLHPTPATCGSPTPAAKKFIAAHEPFDRGWYAGPIGCVSGNESEFSVAIRSMHLRGKYLDVYAGAGIVPGSDPEREWSELEDKISGVLHILAS